MYENIIDIAIPNTANISRAILVFALFVTAVASKPYTDRNLSLSLLIALYGIIFYRLPSFQGMYLFAFSSSLNILEAIHLTLLDNQRSQKQLDPINMPFSDRMKWALNFIVNTRGSKWILDPPSHPRRSSLSRWTFILSQFKWLFICYAMNDMLAYLVWRNPAFVRHQKMGAHGFAWQIWNVGMCWARLANTMQLYHSAVALLFVGAGWSDPADWPALFGSISNATSIRQFWGQTWHQTLYQTVSSYGKSVADVLFSGKQDNAMKATLYTYTRLFASFFVAGLIFATTDYATARDASLSRLIMPVLFCTLQGAGIALEEVGYSIAKKVGVTHRIPTAFGYLWVVIWLTLTSPMLVEQWASGKSVLSRTPYPFFYVAISLIENVALDIAMFCVS